MSFLLPWALFGLLAIPALIIIYILRNKYKEETAPSTYLWEVAAKLLKRKNPLSRFEHLLALIVQCLAIAVFSIALAHPVFTLKEQADDIVFILDASNSMNMKSGENTRFERGVELIREKAQEATNGSTFTLLLAEKEPRILCKKVDDFSRFEMYLDSLKGSEFSTSISDSLSIAQNLFSNGECNLCYLVTDQKCDKTENVTVLDCSDSENNYAITSLTYNVDKDNKRKVSFTGTVWSYTEKVDLDLSFYINGIEMGKLTVTPEIGLPFTFTSSDFLTDGHSIESVEARINNEDGMMKDNSFTVYANQILTETKAYVVSQNPTYLKAIFKALKVDATFVLPANYGKIPSGYDIYVYDSYTPKSLPEIGASMLFNLSNSVEGTGFLVNNIIEPDDGVTLQWSDDDSPLLDQLTREIGKTRDFLVQKYQSYTLINNFTTVLSSGRKPAVFVGRSEFNTREVVFNFDLHNSNIPLLYDFVPLMRNLVEYCKPKLLLDFDYNIGEEALFNIPEEISKIVLTKPSGDTEPLNWEGKELYSYEVKEIGQYKVTITYQDGETKDIYFFSSMNIEESNPQPVAPLAYSLAITDNTKKGDGLLDNILPIVIAAAAFFAADWILYTHEQY